MWKKYYYYYYWHYSIIDEKDCFLFQYFRVLLRNQTPFLLGMFWCKSGWFKVLFSFYRHSWGLLSRTLCMSFSLAASILIPTDEILQRETKNKHCKSSCSRRFWRYKPAHERNLQNNFHTKKSHFRSTLWENCTERMIGNYVGLQYMQTRNHRCCCKTGFDHTFILFYCAFLQVAE